MDAQFQNQIAAALQEKREALRLAEEEVRQLREQIGGLEKVADALSTKSRFEQLISSKAIDTSAKKTYKPRGSVREAVVQVMRDTPMAIEEVFREVQKIEPNVDQPAVGSALRQLAALGKIQKIGFGRYSANKGESPAGTGLSSATQLREEPSIKDDEL